MRILHVIPAFFPATYWGGPIFSTYALCNELAHLGLEIRVLTTDTSGPKLRERLTVRNHPETLEAGYTVYYCAKRLGLSFSPRMYQQLMPLLKWADLVHLTAVYSAPTLPVLLACRAFRKPVVWSPRGALQTWERSRNKTMKSLWTTLCRVTMNPAAVALHVTSRDEERESTVVFPGLPSFLIPNGVEVPEVLPRDRTWCPGGVVRVVFMGRLDPKKGIENLLTAISQMPDIEVVASIYGTGSLSYEDSLRRLVHQLGLEGRVAFKGHVQGDAKRDAFFAADIVVVPSFTENFALVVAEALAHAVPVIASNGTPWQEVASRNCGLWIENTPRAISDAIREMRGRDLERMGRDGRDWMLSDFSWKGVAQKMTAVYASVLSHSLATA
jgi:glycosyltransferase involved in cell wall biosynthesis